MDFGDIANRATSIESLRSHLLDTAPVLPKVATRGDFDLDPQRLPPAPHQLSPAAVLIPIIKRAEPTVLFTLRTDTLTRHAGQVSFPGGAASAGDSSLAVTALRETFEETGILSDFVTIAGFLDAYETGTGYAILPVVGLLSEGFVIQPNVNEVAGIFEVPLSFLINPKNRLRHSRAFNGRVRSFYAFTWDDRYIWGATAAMLVNLGDRLHDNEA